MTIDTTTPRTMYTRADSGTGDTGSTSGTGSDSASTEAPGSSVTKNMFLQLLVAQLRNQDPMHPSDGTQFMTQLAQFEQLEQSLNTGQDVAAIRQDLEQSVGAVQTS